MITISSKLSVGCPCPCSEAVVGGQQALTNRCHYLVPPSRQPQPKKTGHQEERDGANGRGQSTSSALLEHMIDLLVHWMHCPSRTLNSSKPWVSELVLQEHGVLLCEHTWYPTPVSQAQPP